MTQALERVIKRDGITLHLVPSKKYKTMTFVAKLKAPLERETITKRALLPFILRESTKNYSTRKELQYKLDDLYGASLSLDGSKAGSHHVISARMAVANQKYIQNESSIISETLHLLYEVLFQPKVDGRTFQQATVNREKETLRKQIQSLKDDKTNYAQLRLIDEMCQGEKYQIKSHGYEEDLDDITAENLFETYETFIQKDDLDLYILGDFDDDEMIETVTSIFKQRKFENVNDIQGESEHRVVTSPKKLIEQDKVQQAKLHIGYRTYTTYADENYPALVVFNAIFGSYPSSKLFRHVREKNSLAYYVGSFIESYNGLMFVYSGVAHTDYNKAQMIIDEQLEEMRSGAFSEQEMAQAKALIVNGILETSDNAQGLIELLYQTIIGQNDRNIDEYIQQIHSITKEEVVEMANKVKLDTTYVLTSEEA
ncbi:MAG TPA: pitrilysin family protein [Candidatus Dormibacteraeota bacterium]|nr:pitrilysin family protein [Candidatus Dormibacteraeota bacterium]